MPARAELQIDSRTEFGQPREETDNEIVQISPNSDLEKNFVQIKLGLHDEREERTGSFDFSEQASGFHSDSANRTRRRLKAIRRTLKSPIV